MEFLPRQLFLAQSRIEWLDHSLKIVKMMPQMLTVKRVGTFGELDFRVFAAAVVVAPPPPPAYVFCCFYPF